jgi:YfiH family protein
MSEIVMNVESLKVVRVPSWAEFKWLRHGFSTRGGGASTAYADASGSGELNLGFTHDDDPGKVAANRAAFVRAVGGETSWETVSVRQVHGTEVKVAAPGETGLRTDDGRAVVEADGLITAAPGVMLTIQVADCVPVLVADVKRRIVAGFHAGWRGTASGIVEQGIARMVRELGCEPADMVGAVGPSIGACCYTVGDEVRTKFGARFGYAAELFSDREDGMHVDLAEANRRQLVRAGLGAKRVTVIGECTACSRVDGRRKYFSHRAEQGFTGRSMGMIGIARG